MKFTVWEMIFLFITASVSGFSLGLEAGAHLCGEDARQNQERAECVKRWGSRAFYYDKVCYLREER